MGLASAKLCLLKQAHNDMSHFRLEKMYHTYARQYTGPVCIAIYDNFWLCVNCVPDRHKELKITSTGSPTTSGCDETARDISHRSPDNAKHSSSFDTTISQLHSHHG